MISRRTWLRLITLPVLLLLLGIAGHYSWQRLLEREHIHELDWQGLDLSLAGIGLSKLSLLRHDGAGSLQLDLANLTLGWRQFSATPPFWQHIEVEALHARWQPAAIASADEQQTPFNPTQLVDYLAWLPSNLAITRLSAELPCSAGRCTLQGDLHLTRPTYEPLTLALAVNLYHQQEQLTWLAQLSGSREALAVQLALNVNQQPQLTLHSTLHHDAQQMNWSGTLSAPDLSQARVLQSWLGEWALAPGMHLPEAPAAAQLTARWHLQWPDGMFDTEHLRTASGHIAANATLPDPWPLPGIGRLQGRFTAAGNAENGHWLVERLTADLQLDHLPATLLDSVPTALRPEALHLRIQPAGPLEQWPETVAAHTLPLAVELTGSGTSTFDFSARMAIATTAPWALHVGEARLRANTAALAVGGWRTSSTSADLRFSGSLDGRHIQLTLADGSRLASDDLQGDDLLLHQFSTSTSGLQLAARHQDGNLETWHLDGALMADVQRLEHPALNPLGWSWRGQMSATPEQQELKAQLSNTGELQLAVQLHRDEQRNLHLQAQLAELFLRSGNPLAKTLADWPELLDLNNGRLHATASLALAAASSTPELNLDLTGKGLGGIYDRSELSGLDGQLSAALTARGLRIDVPRLHLTQIDPGIPVGPLQLQGQYDAPRDRMSQGTLHLEQGEVGLMEGHVRLSPGQWNLNQANLLFPLHLQGLQLERLFTLYPAEGLAGSGLIDGQLPLRIDANGVRIENGQVAARAPGGRLQFNSERIRALGRSNPAMQLVTQSLEDFRFTTLSSQVNYDRQGKLTLGMRLEGQNPAIEQGRPIHFNINLEEDIPTLLASLQLTDKVNEIIKRRVQQRMLERNAASSPEAP